MDQSVNEVCQKKIHLQPGQAMKFLFLSARACLADSVHPKRQLLQNTDMWSL